MKPSKHSSLLKLYSFVKRKITTLVTEVFSVLWHHLVFNLSYTTSKVTLVSNSTNMSVYISKHYIMFRQKNKDRNMHI